MRIERIHIIVFLAIAALLWWGTLVRQDTPVTWEHGKPFTVVVSALGILWIVFDRFLWRFRLLQGWLVKRPDLRGTWRVELQSSYINPKTGQRVPTIVCYMGVEQTLSELKMHLMTPESESWSIASHIRPSPSGNGYQAICVYNNKPNIHLRDKRISEMHITELSSSILMVLVFGPTPFTAEYWTDRKTMGTMDFNSRVDKVFTLFEDAKRHFEQS